MDLIHLKQTDNHYVLSIPDAIRDRAKKITPNEWDPVKRVWKYPITKTTYDSLNNEFKDIGVVNISPPESNTINQENSLAKKNKIIEDQRKTIEFLKLEGIEKENEIELCVSKIIDLKEEINHLSNNDSDVENVIRKVAKQCVGDNKRFLKIIEETEFDLTLPIELPKKVINILKTILKTQDQNCDFADLICEIREKNLLSPDAISQLYIIKKQRNIFAHSSINSNTKYMRVIFVLSAFALLAEEIQSNPVERLNSHIVHS